MKSLVINDKIAKDYNISKQSLLCLDMIESGEITSPGIVHIASLQSSGLIKLDGSNIIIREKGKELLDLCRMDIDVYSPVKSVKKSSRAINSEVASRINEYRHLWKGLKPGSMGSKKGCSQKLSRWMRENPEYSFDDILKAASLYIATVNNVRYLQQADYFIFKQDTNKEESSRLSAFIEEELSDNDWTSSIK